MPGISFIVSSTLDMQALSRAVDDLRSDNLSSTKILYKDDYFTLVFSGHEGYPYWYHENEDYVVILEGIIYNRVMKESTDKLNAIANIITKSNNAEEEIKDFVNTSDGDFLCVVYSKRSSSHLLFNDRFGRLPAFYYKGENSFALSRETKFLLYLLPSITIDRYGLAQFLMFEHTIGEKTLIKKIKRLFPSRILETTFDKSTSPLRIKSNYIESIPIIFDETNRVPSREYCIKKVKSLFLESLENRFKTLSELGYSCIADVSGGFDTRAVLMGIEKLGLNVNYFTHRLVTGDESRVAVALGKTYGKDVQYISSSHEIDYDEMEKIVYTTDCMVNGWTALTCWRDSFDKRQVVGGNTACFMGFGGEYIRHPFLPARGHNSIQSMLRAKILKAQFNAEWSSFLSGIPYITYVDSLAEHFENYPESTFVGKLKHYYYEYHYLLTAGEDRTRNFFWTVSPFLGTDILSFMMNSIPLEYANYSFFTGFLREINSRGLKVPIYGSRVNLDSRLSVALLDITATVRFHIRNHILGNKFSDSIYSKLRRFKRDNPIYKEVATTITNVHESLHYFKKYFEKEQIEQFIIHGYGLTNLYRLLSVLMYFKQLEERFAEKISVD